ncbi:MAG: hypothetical protein V2J07_03845 [Anaerolineae bacterium]|nr:hypothetical protein [Anaerolineae bacterium]
MKVRILDTSNRRDVRAFVQFPFDLYKDCQNWCPPIRLDITTLMNRKHPLYQAGDADWFVVESEGQIVGRIAINTPKAFSAYKGREFAFFYYYDVVEDLRASQMLFDAIEDWSKKRGVEIIEGPTSFTRSGSKGLLVEGFEYKAPVGVNYNYPYYGKFVESSGYVFHLDWRSGHIDTQKDQLDPRIHQIAERLKERGKYEVQTFKTKKEMKAVIPEIYQINEEAFIGSPEYIPYTLEEFQAMADDLIAILEPGLPKVIRTENGKAIGFVLAYPDISDGIRKAKGRLLPFGWFHLLRSRKTTTNLVLNGVGIIPKYQGRGANALLYSEMNKIRTDYPQYKTADNLQVASYNDMSFADMSSVGTHWGVVHREYEKEI